MSSWRFGGCASISAPDLAEHHRERLLAEHVRLQLVDQRGLHLHRLRQ
jgi:hypothetical protein